MKVVSLACDCDKIATSETVRQTLMLSGRQNQCLNPKIKALMLMSRLMLKTLWATVHQGKIELLEPTELPDGTRVLVTLLPDDEASFWHQASEISLDAVWDNTEDDVYAQLL